MFITLPTIAELQNVQLWSSAVFVAFVALWAVSYTVARVLDWLADWRHFNAVMASRETGR